jgi:acetyl-CoA C-acetyltransferase
MDPRTPVIVGVGQVTNRRPHIAHVLDMLEEVSHAADADAGGHVLDRIDAVQEVSQISWRSPAPASLLARRLGIEPRERTVSTVGGSTPQSLVNEACDRIVAGEINGVLIAGCEAFDSVRRATKEGVSDDRGRSDELPPDQTMGDDRSPVCPEELAARLVAPASIYPMFEQALARRDGRAPDEQRVWLGELMAPFTKVAASHPDLSWFPTERTAKELSEISDDNRMVAEPYTKNLNAILQVDMAAAIIVMSMEAAGAAGVPKDQWIFPWAGAKCDDVWFLAQRPHFDRSVALEAVGKAVFPAAGIGVDDVTHIDLYSCFPSAVQMSAEALGIPLDDKRGLTLTGGLPYFGGPGNNYVTHSIAMLVGKLRDTYGDEKGLVTGISWYCTKMAMGIYGASPPPNGWQHPDMKEEQARIDATALDVMSEAEGVATVDGFTVEHDKDFGPLRAPLYATLEDGRRVVAVPADTEIPKQLSGRSIIGERVKVRTGEGSPVYEL